MCAHMGAHTCSLITYPCVLPSGIVLGINKNKVRFKFHKRTQERRILEESFKNLRGDATRKQGKPAKTASAR